ncbi:MAG: heavy metal transporter [Bacteroidetes bacterium]|nr:MAG: heavy metal transporter [Bacteroidota bacterium]
MNSNSNKQLIGAGVIAAIASSLCCVVPVIAAVASVSGIAASASWLEPARPYLIWFTVVVLGFAWYQHIKNKRSEIECDCDDDVPAGASVKKGKPSFFQSSKFLGIVTAFSVLMLAFPLYSEVFFSESEKTTIVVGEENIAEGRLEIKGMTCTGCEHHVTKSLADHEAVIEANSSYTEGLAMVKFDKSRTTLAELSEIVEEETGYTVISQEIIN